MYLLTEYMKYGHWVVLVLAQYVWSGGAGTGTICMGQVVAEGQSDGLYRPFLGFHQLSYIPNRTEHFKTGFDFVLW
jgi:hypothetical protein